MENVKQYVEMFSTLDNPVPYNNLLIYPIRMKDCYMFNMTYNVLTIEKNKIPDIKIIQMSYLDYLFEYVFSDVTKVGNTTIGAIYMGKFLDLLKLCFQVEYNEIKYAKSDKGYSLMIRDEKINSVDFDVIKKIISFQNIYDYDDVKMNDDFKKAMQEYYAVKNRNMEMPTIEQKMAIISSANGMSKKDFIDMTYREFESVFKYCVDRVDYEINKSAELKGEVKFDKPVEHWVYQQKKNKYMDAFVSASEVKDKVTKMN